jgi:hypothetical protein
MVTQHGFAYILQGTGDTAGRAAGSGTLSSPESIPNHHHYCIMNLAPVAFFWVAFLQACRYRCLNDAATARLTTRMELPPMLCLLYVRWLSVQNHNSCTGSFCLLYVRWYSIHSLKSCTGRILHHTLKITDSGVMCEEITFNLVRLKA